MTAADAFGQVRTAIVAMLTDLHARHVHDADVRGRIAALEELAARIGVMAAEPDPEPEPEPEPVKRGRKRR